MVGDCIERHRECHEMVTPSYPKQRSLTKDFTSDALKY